MELNEPGAKCVMLAGCKQAGIGEMPLDWDAQTLGDLAASISRGASPRPIDDPIWFEESSRVGWVRISDITSAGRHLKQTTQWLSEKGIQHSRFIPSGSLIMSICATVGRPVETCIDTCIHDGFVVFTDPQVDQGFLFHVLKDLEPKWREKGQTGSQMNLNTALIKGTSVPVPRSPKEQASIAKALTEADALIESLEQLLTKKRQIKQGTMQQLLTGQRRLPGFSDDWLSEIVGAIAEVKTGPFGSSLHESDYVNDGTPIVTVEHLGEFGLTRQNLPMVSASDRQRLRSYELEAGDIVFSRVGSVDRNALVRYEETGWLFSGRLLRVRPNRNRVAPEFLSYQFHSERFKASVVSVAVGQTMASLNTSILRGLRVMLPCLEEQTAIASILSDMDAEIIALEARLSKARHLKQGMAQALLTGRIRLVPRSEAS
jgi:type I restriction enzyme S subunit